MSIRKPPSRLYGFFIFSCAALALATSASATEVVRLGADQKVQYQDLDLNTAAGAEALLARIRSAAAGVCAPMDQGTAASLRMRKKREACELQLTAQAVARVNQPLVVAAHASSLRKGRSKV